jgi:hypothetical protein
MKAGLAGPEIAASGGQPDVAAPGNLSRGAGIFNTRHMNYTRARGRYLAALGLTATFGCHGAEPSPSVGTDTAAVATPPSTTTTTAPPQHHTGPWVPTAAAASGPPRHPGIAICPHGPFCVPQPTEAGAAPVPTPDETCSLTAPIPDGMGPAATLNGRTPGVTFDAASTATERASDPAACCYQWHVLCVGGRALRGAAGPVTAATTARGDWVADDPEVSALPEAEREALAVYWEREAAFEHASVAAFAQASLLLLAVGAPADLVAATHAAAIDEVEHARLTYALASAYGGARRGPGPLAIASAVGGTGEVSLARLAVDTFVDGCAGEAAAALALREAAAVARDPGVRATLTRIAEDEERHAELAFRTVAWALSAGGPQVARALSQATETLGAELAADAPPAPAAVEPDRSAHGALSEAARRVIRRRALAEVVLPCAEAMLATVGSGAGLAERAGGVDPLDLVRV